MDMTEIADLCYETQGMHHLSPIVVHPLYIVDGETRRWMSYFPPLSPLYCNTLCIRLSSVPKKRFIAIAVTPLTTTIVVFVFSSTLSTNVRANIKVRLTFGIVCRLSSNTGITFIDRSQGGIPKNEKTTLLGKPLKL